MRKAAGPFACRQQPGCCQRHRHATGCADEPKPLPSTPNSLGKHLAPTARAPLHKAIGSAVEPCANDDRKHPVVAVCYYGMTRSLSNTIESHRERLFNVLRAHGLAHRIYVHTWRLSKAQDIWGVRLPQPVNESEVELLGADSLARDEQQPFLDELRRTWSHWFNRSAAGAALPFKMGSVPVAREALVRNHLCALESQRRCLALMRRTEAGAARPAAFALFVRPDLRLLRDFPVDQLLRMRKHDVLLPHPHGPLGLACAHGHTCHPADARA